MNCKTIFRNILLSVFVLSMGIVLYPNHTAAFTLRNADIDHIVHSETDYKINALVMEVNLKKAYVVVGEIQIYFMDFKAGGKRFRTAFVKKSGYTSYASSVKASQWEGKRVLVKGYRLSSGDIVAESIKKMPKHKK